MSVNPNPTYQKLNDRTVKRACHDCKRWGYYWFVGTDGRKVQVEKTHSTFAANQGDYVSAGSVYLHRVDGVCRTADWAPKGAEGVYLPRATDQPASGSDVPVTSGLVSEDRPAPFGELISVDTGKPILPPVPDMPVNAAQSVSDGLSWVANDVDTPADVQTAFGAFQDLMRTLAPKVDRVEVDAMINQRLNGLDDQIVRVAEAIVSKAFEDTVKPPATVITELASGAVNTVDNAHFQLGEVVEWILAGDAPLLVGPAGSGKSTLARGVAAALDIPCYSIPLNPMLTESKIFGYMNAAGKYVGTLFRMAFEHGGVFLLDEIDTCHSGVLCMINEALATDAGKQASFPDGMVTRHKNFVPVAAANTFGRGADRVYCGRNQLDAATLDRFCVLEIGYDEALEQHACLSTGCETDEVKRVLKFVRDRRKSAERQKMHVVISPRASIKMSAARRVGISFERAAEGRLYKGMSDQDRSKLESGIYA